jgi:hypothetical protein
MSSALNMNRAFLGRNLSQDSRAIEYEPSMSALRSGTGLSTTSIPTYPRG